MEEKILAALAQLNGKFDTMQSDMSEMKADIAGLKTDVTGLKTDVAELKTDVAELKTHVATLEKEQAGMAAQLHENHMLLTAVREAQELHRAEIDHLKVSTASRKSLEHLKTTISTQLISMGEAVANA